MSCIVKKPGAKCMPALHATSFSTLLPLMMPFHQLLTSHAGMLQPEGTLKIRLYTHKLVQSVLLLPCDAGDAAKGRTSASLAEASYQFRRLTPEGKAFFLNAVAKGQST